MLATHPGICSGAECPQCFPCLFPSVAAPWEDSRGLAVRTDATALLPSTTIIVPHGRHWPEGGPWQVLCHQRADNGYWGFPGGAQQVGESLAACAVREMEEECGILVDILGAVAIDSDPARGAVCVYPNGTVHYCNVTFLATWITGKLVCSEESVTLRWCSTAALPEPFLPTHRWRLAQAMAHQGAYIALR